MPIENQSVRDYLLKRKAEREALEQENAGFDTTGAVTGALSSLGAAFQGKDSIAAGMGALERSKAGRKDALKTFDTDTERGQLENVAMVEDDPESEQSKMADQLARRMGYKGGPVTAAKFKTFSPALEKMYDIEQRKLDREESRAERRSLADLARQDRLDARSDKKKELSAAQAKQRGLYEMGKKSEEQFSKASGSSDYDPTSYVEFLDNDQSGWVPNWAKSDKAVEAQSAQNSWIESFLRDASGAAIPHSERASYAQIYFPQKGDSPEAVANKAALRAQKQDSARIAAGVETGHGPADTAGAPQTKVVNGVTYKKVPGGWQEVTTVGER